jgi:hypothetical protein
MLLQDLTPTRMTPTRNFIEVADISRKFPSDPRLFSPENEEISTPPPLWIPDWNISIL